jgi:hypothetical protein
LTSVARCVFWNSATITFVSGASVLEPSTTSGGVGALAEDPQAAVTIVTAMRTAFLHMG